MRRLICLLCFLCGVLALQAQRPKTLQFVRLFDYEPSADLISYDSTLHSEVRYDRKGRPVERIYMEQGRLSSRSLMEYDAKDRLKISQAQDSTGKPIGFSTYAYDDRGRLLQISTGASLAQLHPERRYVYQGNYLMRIEELSYDPPHYRQWVRDSVGNPIREDGYWGEPAGTQVMATYAWDTLAQRWLRITPKINGSWSVLVCKDADCQQFVEMRSYTWDSIFPSSRWEFDARGYETRMESFKSSGKTESLTYLEHDPYGNVIGRSQPLETAELPQVVVERGYDALGRKIHQIEYAVDGKKTSEIYWEYDSLGRCIRTLEPNYIRETQFAYDARNRIAGYREILQTPNIHKTELDMVEHDTTDYEYRYDSYDSLSAIFRIGDVSHEFHWSGKKNSIPEGTYAWIFPATGIYNTLSETRFGDTIQIESSLLKSNQNWAYHSRRSVRTLHGQPIHIMEYNSAGYLVAQWQHEDYGKATKPRVLANPSKLPAENAGLASAHTLKTLMKMYKTDVMDGSVERTFLGYEPNPIHWIWLKLYNDGRLVRECPHNAVCWQYQYDAAKRLKEAWLYYDTRLTEHKVYNYDAQGRLILEISFDERGKSVSGYDYRYPTPNRCVISTRIMLKPKSEYRLTYWN